MISNEYFYSNDQCAYFCEVTDQNSNSIESGTELCCDYEQWSDGSYDCSLYKGNGTILNNNGTEEYSQDDTEEVSEDDTEEVSEDEDTEMFKVYTGKKTDSEDEDTEEVSL